MKKVLISSSAFVIIVAVVLSVMLLPTVILTPSDVTQAWLKENNVMVSTGLFYVSDEDLSEFVNDTIENVGADKFRGNQLQMYDDALKRGKGILTNGVVCFDLGMLSANDEQWENTKNTVNTFSRGEGSLEVTDIAMFGKAERDFDWEKANVGYKIY